MSVKVEEGYRVDWYRVKLPKGMLSELNKRSDLRGLWQAGGHVGLIVCSGAGAWWVYENMAWYWFVLALYVHGTMCSFAVNAVHELIHDTVFKTKWLNGFFACLFGLLGWINHYAFWLSHVEHHRYTLHDPHDLEVVVPIRIRLKDFWRTFVDPYAAWWTVKHHAKFAVGKSPDGWHEYLFEKGKKQDRQKVFWWSRFLFLFHVVFGVVCVLSGYWVVFLIVSCTPLYGKTLQFLMNNTQHVGLADHVNDFRLNSRTFETNRFFAFLYWQMNYHIEHHMYMGVPCYRLRELHRAIEGELPHTCRGLVELWWHVLAVMYMQKEYDGWVYEPMLPGVEDGGEGN
ncbi:fatty acid desaturase [Planctomycetota bacterium]|nr:fatty acid desaturase [Planctomycetota bacterium]